MIGVFPMRKKGTSLIASRRLLTDKRFAAEVIARPDRLQASSYN